MSETEKAILAGGCFWCTEAVFKPVKGVKGVVSGYIGGETENPSYHEVCSGTTGHAEAVEITFDPEVVSYDTLLDVFFATHDPTQVNRQGNDVGTQYRSGVFTLSEEQAAAARAAIERAGDIWSSDIVTEVTEAGTFHAGEDYHQDYFANNPYQPYCQAVIAPKVAKARQKYAHLLA
ncbi:MAG: peptide-methionine (S)-S-oxide reductase MsrA [Alphaproteobacteria bacterium]|nr:peptide-methionine (S)-S-oxide reductase MsrA [Alphaproteobacteria bacterium]MCY4496554.1 peptide-methionine (S)-S-oxide reductase MsrA [Rhodospirillaceae bacterium]